ncbi:MAG: hypothetical protein ACI31P_08420, partial [Ligilactobacillus ruminis]
HLTSVTGKTFFLEFACNLRPHGPDSKCQVDKKEAVLQFFVYFQIRAKASLRLNHQFLNFARKRQRHCSDSAKSSGIKHQLRQSALYLLAVTVKLRSSSPEVCDRTAADIL